MMREVLVERNAVKYAALLQSPLDSLETRQGLEGELDFDTRMRRGADGRECVLEIVPAEQGPPRLPDSLPLVQDTEPAFGADQIVVGRPVSRSASDSSRASRLGVATFTSEK